MTNKAKIFLGVYISTQMKNPSDEVHHEPTVSDSPIRLCRMRTGLMPLGTLETLDQFVLAVDLEVIL